jgi:hypothetical protein
MHSKRRLYLSVLGVCGAALLVDRVFLGPQEASAQAGESDLAQITAPPSGVPEAQIDGRLAARSAMAARLAHTARTHGLDPMQVGDAFRAHQSWTPAVAQAAEPDRLQQAAAEFTSAHQISAVMVGGPSSLAVIDGQGLRQGATLDGFTLVKVTDNGATFERDGVVVELLLRRTEP